MPRTTVNGVRVRVTPPLVTRQVFNAARDSRGRRVPGRQVTPAGRSGRGGGQIVRRSNRG